jgi:ligand-binding sensor domain-containing protein/AraC-like DNA-binding protein
LYDNKTKKKTTCFGVFLSLKYSKLSQLFMNTRHSYILVLLLALLPQFAIGTGDFFKKITVAEGLSNNFVRVIHKDSEGFIWFGTLDGLDRYDGTNLKSYKHKFPEDHQRVNCIADIHENSLWVGTDKGLLFWDYISSHFTKLPLLADQKEPKITTLLTLPGDSILLAGSSQGIFRINTITFEVRKIIENNEMAASAFITDMIYFKNDVVWFSSRYFIAELNLKDETVSVYTNELQSEEYSSFSAITLLDGNIVAGTLTKGLFIFDTKQKQFRSMNKIETNYILSVEHSADGKLYVGTDGEGLFIHDLQTDSIKNYAHSLSETGSLNSNAIYSLLIEENGRIWTGTYSGGVNYLLSTKNFFSVSLHDNDILVGEQNIRSLHFDNIGNKYLGTDGNGIIFFLDNGRKFQVKNDSPFLRSNAILTITPFNDKVLIGTFRGGITLFNRTTLRFENFRNENVFLNGSIYGIDFDTNGMLWIGGLDGLSKIDTLTGNFRQFNTYNSIMKDQLIIAIHFDSMGRLWTGSVNGGTEIFDISQDELKLIDHNLDLADVKAVSFSEDQAGNIWISSEGRGLIRIDANLKERKNFTIENGLPSDMVTASTEAPDGIFWISTSKGLCRYNSQNDIFTKYGLSDGLPGLVFNRGAVVNQYQKNGKIWFGSEKGLVSFYPDSLLNRQNSTKVIITDLFLSGQIVEPNINGILPRPVEQCNSVEIGAGQKSIGFQFVALNFGHNTDNEFAYRLLNHNDEWKLTKENSVTYSNLKPGRYGFEIYHYTGTTPEQANPTRFTIVITPPFYTKPQFILLFGTLVLVIFLSIIFYTKKITRSIKMLKQGKRFKDHEGRYESSHLSTQKKKEIEILLVNYIKENKPYLNPDLKLSDLAQHVDCPAHYISQVLNQNLKQSFYEFINSYRVDAVKKCMNDPAYKKYTLLAIGQECGFNSKTSLYRAFKKSTGKSPQEYMALLKTENQLS